MGLHLENSCRIFDYEYMVRDANLHDTTGYTAHQPTPFPNHMHDQA